MKKIITFFTLLVLVVQMIFADNNSLSKEDEEFIKEWRALKKKSKEAEEQNKKLEQEIDDIERQNTKTEKTIREAEDLYKVLNSAKKQK